MLERVHFTKEIIYGDCILEYDSKRAKPIAMQQNNSSTIEVLTNGRPISTDNNTRYTDAFFIETQKHSVCTVRRVFGDEAREFFFHASHKWASLIESNLFSDQKLTLEPLKEK